MWSGKLKRDRAAMEESFPWRPKGAARTLGSDDYENTLKELRVTLNKEDLAAAFELIDERA